VQEGVVVSITSPPRGPEREHDRHLERRVSDLEALIVEARRRARRRRVGIALALAGVAVGVASLGGFFGGGGRGAGAIPLAGDSHASDQTVIARKNGQILMYNWDSGASKFVNPNGSGLRNAPSALATSTSSPGGKQAAFFHRDALELVGAGGQHPRRLADCGGCQELSWSPGGSRIAVSDWSNIWVVDAKTGAMRLITDCPVASCIAPNSIVSALEWSPTGGRILFTGPGRSGPYSPYNWSLETIRPDGSDPTTLTAGPPSTSGSSPPYPQWSPDGGEIAFDLHNGIYIINANGTGLRRLVANGGHPVWSPGGTRLLYATFGSPPAPVSRPWSRHSRLWSGHIKLWVINADGSDNRLLYRYPLPIGDSRAWWTAFWAAHVWSPDGRKIAFSTFGTGSTLRTGAAYVIDADRSDLHRIARGWWPELTWQRVP
jgi:hypothetical protein